MPDIKATDLPIGSIVAARFDPSEYVGAEHFHPAGAQHVVYVRQDFDTAVGVFRWMCGRQGVSTTEVQQAIDGGGVILREGEG